MKRNDLIKKSKILIERQRFPLTNTSFDLINSEKKFINFLQSGATKILEWDSGYTFSFYEDVTNADQDYIKNNLDNYKHKNMRLMIIED